MASTVTTRRLQRETPAVLREVEEHGQPVVVTRNGEEIVRIVPLSAAERLWRSWVRDAGGDPDDQRFRQRHDATPALRRPGARLSGALAELREQER